MDYRTFVTKYEELKNEINEFSFNKRSKNFSRGEEILSSYKEQIENGDFSLKSFKAKIIHNELEHKRTITEFEELLSNNKVKLFELLNNYFEEYEQDYLNTKSFYMKRSDLSAYNSSIRKQKQEIINKANNIDKESIIKIREDENSFNEKENAYNQEIIESNRRLNIDLQKVNDQAIKQYSDIERELLDVDDVKQIVLLKNKIKDVRLSCLKLQCSLKTKAYKSIFELKNTFAIVKEEFSYNMSLFKNEISDKIEELEYKKSLLDNNLDVKSDLYDFDYRKKCLLDIKEYRNMYLSYAIKHNDFMYKLESSLDEEIDKDEFLYNYLLVNLYKFLIELQIKNIFNPLSRIILLFIKTIEEFRKNISEVHNEITSKRYDNSREIKSFITSKEYSTEREKKHPKALLVENAYESIKRYYNNILGETNYIKEKIFFYLREYLIQIYSLYNKLHLKNELFEEVKLFNDNENLIAMNKISFNYLNLYEFGYNKIEYDDNKLEDVKANNVILQMEINKYRLSIDNNYNQSIEDINIEIKEYDNKNKKYLLSLLKKHADFEKNSKTNVTSYLIKKNKNISNVKKIIKEELNSNIKEARKYLKYKSKVL